MWLDHSFLMNDRPTLLKQSLERYYYFLSLLSIILLGIAKAVGGREPWLILIVIIPGLYYYPLLGKSGKVSPQKSQIRLNRKTGSDIDQKVLS